LEEYPEFGIFLLRIISPEKKKPQIWGFFLGITSIYLVRPEGLETPTFWFVERGAATKYDYLHTV
jgi:hypothetical protein